MVDMKLRQIATIRTPFAEKFGAPRQSGLVPVTGEVVFLPEYRDPNALRGIADFTHLWLIWGFSEVPADAPFSPTVRPPRLGGNKRMGVFATRAPWRPNPLGLSAVRLCEVRETDGEGMVLVVSGVDMKDGTPIYDIKPYLPYTDSRPDASGGFADAAFGAKLRVVWRAENVPFSESERETLAALLAEDPRPSYQTDAARVYGFPYAGREVQFTVDGDTLYVETVQWVQG